MSGHVAPCAGHDFTVADHRRLRTLLGAPAGHRHLIHPLGSLSRCRQTSINPPNKCQHLVDYDREDRGHPGNPGCLDLVLSCAQCQPIHRVQWPEGDGRMLMFFLVPLGVPAVIASLAAIRGQVPRNIHSG